MEGGRVSSVDGERCDGREGLPEKVGGQAVVVRQEGVAPWGEQ